MYKLVTVQLIPEQIRNGNVIKYHQCEIDEDNIREGLIQSLVLEWGTGVLKVELKKWVFYLD